MNTSNFQPHPLFRGGNAQTVAALWWPATRFFPEHVKKTNKTTVDAQNTLITHSQIQQQKPLECDDILLVHGFEGSSVSKYMLRMAKKGLQRGFNVHRMNLRSCGNSINSCALPYHAGLWNDVLEVAKQVKTGKRMFVVGYSLGGNLVLKMAGELQQKLPSFITAIASVSAPIDLEDTLDWLMQKKMYHKKFLSYIVKNYKRKKRIHPQTFPDLDDLPCSLIEFDERIICQMYGFKDAKDYYTQSSCGSVIESITAPTLIIYSKDDPIIPYTNYLPLHELKNKNIELLSSCSGGHVAFIGNGKIKGDDDRFWADERIFSFFSRF